MEDSKSKKCIVCGNWAYYKKKDCGNSKYFSCDDYCMVEYEITNTIWEKMKDNDDMRMLVVEEIKNSKNKNYYCKFKHDIYSENAIDIEKMPSKYTSGNAEQ